MRARWRAAAMAVAGLLVAVVPSFVASQPAGADTEVVTRASVTFVAYDGTTVTCDVADFADRYDNHTAHVYAAPEGPQPNCGTNVDITVTISAKDENGSTRTSIGTAKGSSDVTIDHAYSAVQTTAMAYFNECDPRASATCHVTTTAAPK